MPSSDAAAVQREFMAPPQEYGAIPWWCWTGDLAEDELERQMRSMREQGLSQFFIFPYGPQDVEYLSEEWLDRVEFVVQKAAELGMRVWIYDEWDWPSGIAGGKVSAHREYRARTLAEFDVTSPRPGPLELELPVGNMKDWRLEYCLAAPLRDGKPDITRVENLAGKVSPTGEGVLTWEAPEQDWMLMALVSFTPDMQTFQGHYVDLLNPEVTRCFIGHTHEAYYRRLGRYFGTVIPGFFMDECFYMSTVHGDADSLDAPMAPWTPKLEQELAARGVTGPEQYWWAVFHDVGRDTRPRRALFWNALSHLLADSLYGVLADWCDEHNVVLTGHGCESSNPYHMLAHTGTHFPQMSRMQIPGIDMLGGPSLVRGGRVYRRMIPKLSSCVSHHKGQKRVFAEAPNLLNWEATLAQIKQTTDWLAGTGINMFCPCSFMYTQFMHRHSPEPFGYQWPHWNVIKPYFDYVRRISYLLSQGRHVCDVAVYHPMLNVCAEFDRREDPLRKGKGHLTDGGGFLMHGLNLITAALLEHQVDFDFVYDEALRGAAIEDGALRIGDDRYRAIVLPPVELMAADVAARFRACAQAGVRLIALGRLPDTMLEVPGSRDHDAADKACLREGDDAVVVRTQPLEEASAPGVEARLLEAVHAAVPPDVLMRADKGPSENIVVQHRGLDDGDLYFFANPGDEPVQAEVSLLARGAVECWNPEDGAVSAMPACREENGRTVFNHRFLPCASLVVAVRCQGAGALPAASGRVARGQPLVLDDAWRFETTREQALPLSTLHVSPGTGHYHGRMTYEAEFEVERIPSKVALLVDCMATRSLHPSRGMTQVRINGQEVGPLGWNRSVDRKFREADITSGVKQGHNRVTLEVTDNAWFGPPVLATMMLFGRFKVLDGDRLAPVPDPETLTTGSWAEQGYPYYSGAGVYTQEFEATGDLLEAGDVLLCIEDCAHVAEVSVNDKTAGARLWPPYEVLVGGLLKQGVNVVHIRVMNAMANMMLGKPVPSGLTGRVKLVPLVDQEGPAR